MSKIIKIEVPTFDGSLKFNWQPWKKISVRVFDGNEVVIVANKEGLVSLANHLMNLAQEEVPVNYLFT